MVRNTTPLVAIYQEFLLLPSELTRQLKACIVGPNYWLARYSESDEKARGYLGAYDRENDTSYSWPNKPAGGVVDLSYVKAYVESAVMEYFQDVVGDSSVIQAGSSRNRIVAETKVWRTANGYSRSAELYSRDVQVGDRIRIIGTPEGEDPIEFNTTVVGFDYAVIPATLPATGTAGDYNHTTASASSSATKTTGFANITATPSHAVFSAVRYGRTTEKYYLVCTRAMTGSDLATAKFRVVSASGLDNVAELSISDFGVATTFGKFNARVTLTNAGSGTIAVNDTYELNYAQSYSAPIVTIGGTYSGASDTTYIITATGIDNNQVVFTATTTDGTDYSGPHKAAVDVATTIGNRGVTVSFSAIPCPTDRWYAAATARTAGKCNTLLLAKSMPEELYEAINADSIPGDVVPEGEKIDLDVTLYMVKTITLRETLDYSKTASQISVLAGIQGYSSDWTSGGSMLPMSVVSGSLYSEYRALVPTYSYAKSTIQDITTVESVLGPACADNPLSLAVYKALQNSNGVEVGFVATATDDASGYAAALEAIKDDFAAYSVVPCTQLKAIQDLVVAHVNAQSNPERSRFRITWLNSASSNQAAIETVGSDSLELKATITDDTESVGTQNIMVYADNGLFMTSGVRAGDILRTNYQPDGSYDSYVVDSIEGDDRLKLLAGPSIGINVPQKIEIWRTLSQSEEAAVYAAKSAAFANRRVRHIWPDKVELSDGTQVAGFYLCAALAGVRSASAPHRPLTTVELLGFASVRRSTQDMHEEHLDIMATSGTWVITQELSGGNVYTRMGLTTDTTDENRWQDARTSNADSLSFAYRIRLKNLVGKTNIGPKSLAYIRNEILAAIEYFKGSSSTPELGPQLLAGEILSGPSQHSVLKDTVEIELSQSLPYELDRVNTKLYIS